MRDSLGRIEKGTIPHNKKWQSKTCIIDGCTQPRPSGNRGMCNSHYMRWWRTGDANAPIKVLKNKPAIDRFYFMVEKTNTCWIWKGALDKRGYGRISDDSGWYDMAHRWSYKHFKGQIPEGLVVHHKCVVPKCVNPDHLEVETHRGNIIDKGATNAAFVNSIKTHCKNGHEFTPDNTYLGKSKYGSTRTCKICHKNRMQKYHIRKSIRNEGNLV